MKTTVLTLALFFGLFLSSASFVVAADPVQDATNGKTEKSDLQNAHLNKMGMTKFGGAWNIASLARVVMSFLGKTIVFAAVLGFMIGGGFMVASAGDEGMRSRGKDIMIASVVGLSVTLLSYLIITFVQSLIYSVGDT